jgi:hypothetical protein
VPHVPKRPPALAHVSDEAASIVLARHFGDFVKAAQDLGVKRTDLRRLTWHNPRILRAAHERIGLFRIGVKSKILEAVGSSSAKRRRWGVDAMFDSYEFRDNPFASARWAMSAQRERAAAAGRARVVLEQEASAELARERVIEVACEQAAELEGDRRRESETVVAEIERPRKVLPVQGGSLWPAGIRRPSKRGWR